jgi:hypothetical protein
MRGRGRYRASARAILGLAAAATIAGFGGARNPGPGGRLAAVPARSTATCIRLWNELPGRHRAALAIAVQGALPDRGVYVTLRAPRGAARELGATPVAAIRPGRCVLGEQRNLLFVLAGDGWHMITPTDSSDPALAVVYAAGDHPNAQADLEGFLAPGG